MDRVRFQMRISPETDRKIKAAMPLANCQSQNEFVEQALKFYCEYLSAKDCSEILPPILTAAFRGAVQDSEDRTARLLFKLAVEISMMMQVLAAGMEVGEEDLGKLRARCVTDVKKTNGSISLTDAIRFQKGL